MLGTRLNARALNVSGLAARHVHLLLQDLPSIGYTDEANEWGSHAWISDRPHTTKSTRYLVTPCMLRKSMSG